MSKNAIIMGAAGRDFHNFNTLFRGNGSFRIVAFTATQIPDIDGRRYPAALAGPTYQDGIPIYAEEELPRLIKEHDVDTVIFSYSDISHETVMHAASLANSYGAHFMLPSPQQTMLSSTKPVVAVCAVRTGCGKSPVTRKVCELLKQRGLTPAIIRHPMPYGDLEKQAVQRFATLEDMDAANCTIEEREEYEHHVEQGLTVFAGVDYERILREAEKEADVILWDGGNNDTPFIAPDVYITVLDPLRPGHELGYHPGETNLRLADIALVNKVNTADEDAVQAVCESVRQHAPKATLVKALSEVTVDNPELVIGKRVLLVEDGPTLTHGEMTFGAAQVAAELHGAAEIVDPRGNAKGSIAETYAKYDHLTTALPAMGYSGQQLADLEATINATDCDSVLLGTPIKLDRLITIAKPVTRVRYSHADHSNTTLEQALFAKLKV